jgi:hypothetical protein
VDLPAPPTVVDLPAPPTVVDLPAPPTVVDLPAPPTVVDLPAPPAVLDLPAVPAATISRQGLTRIFQARKGLPLGSIGGHAGAWHRTADLRRRGAPSRDMVVAIGTAELALRQWESVAPGKLPGLHQYHRAYRLVTLSNRGRLASTELDQILVSPKLVDH